MIPQTDFPTLTVSWEDPDILLTRLTTRDTVDVPSIKGFMEMVSKVQEKGLDYFLVVDLGKSPGVSNEARTAIRQMNFQWKCRGIFLVGGTLATRTVITLMTRVAAALGRLKTDTRAAKTMQDARREIQARRTAA